MEILKKIIKKEEVTDEDIANELYEMCDSVHSSCDSECLIYAINDETPDTANDFEENRGCDYFKNGTKMLKRLREEYYK